MAGSDAAERGSRDHYEVLGVGADASAAEIKASFRRLAAHYHPDRGGDDRRRAVFFKRINASYQVLSDPAKRDAYDRLTRPIDDSHSRQDKEAESVPPPEWNAEPTPRNRAREQEPDRQSEAYGPPSGGAPASYANPRAGNPHVNVEAELLRDHTVVVTTHRLMRRDQPDVFFTQCSAVQVIHETPVFGTLVLGCLSFAVLALSALFLDGHTSRIACAIGASSTFVGALRPFFTDSRWFVRLLLNDGSVVYGAAGGSSRWASDVSEAVDAGIQRQNRVQYRGRAPWAPVRSGESRALEAIGLGLAMPFVVALGCYVVVDGNQPAKTEGSPTDVAHSLAPSTSALAPPYSAPPQASSARAATQGRRRD